MTKVYLPLSDGMYKRIDVPAVTKYLDDGWFLSISDHQAHVAKLNKIPVATNLFDALPVQVKVKRKPRKNPEAE